MKLKVIILLISLLSGSLEAQEIHYNAFSHNDYERPRPLFDALSFRFNCVEADLWLIVPLYFAKERPCVEIDGNLIMADDDRLPEQYRDQIEMRMVRFRTLGCWPLTGAVESNADTIEKIVEEMMTTTKSERTTRVIDFDQDASMEQKKREGYF